MGMLSGYKTYVASVVSVLGALAAYLTGEAQLADTVQIVISAVLASTLRHGIAKS